MSKKGVSDIIATVLIILLVLAAIIIVWQAVNKTVRSGTEKISGEIECIGLDISPTAVLNVSTSLVNVTVSRALDDIAGNALTVVATCGSGNSANSSATLNSGGIVKVQINCGADLLGAKTTVRTALKKTDGSTCTGGEKEFTF